MTLPSKDITIQLWNDLHYCRAIGIYYPEAPEPIELTNPDMEQPYFNDAPFLIVLSSVYTPRDEVMGDNPVCPGQHPMPKEFMESQIRHMSYLFANEFGIFQPDTKAQAKSFIAKQTVSYTMVKEIQMNVRPANGSMSLRDLRNSIDQYTEEEQEEIQVMTIGENPIDADAKHIEQFIHSDKIDTQQRQYISVTKLADVYGIEDPYIKNTQMPEDPAFSSLPPGTADADMSQEFVAEAEGAIETDNFNRDSLKTFDELAQPTPVMNEEGEPMVDEETGEPIMEVTKPDRIAVLEQMVKDRDTKLIDAGLKKPTIPVDDFTPPPPMSESEMYPQAAAENEADATANDEFTPRGEP